MSVITPDLQELIRQLDERPEGLGSAPYLVVVDANALLRSIRYRASTGITPNIIGVSAGAPWRIFATTAVLGEVVDKMPRLAGGNEELLGAMRAVFESEFRSVITWVEVDHSEHTDRRVTEVRERDPDDAATAVLAELLAPCLVWSDDGDLIEPGIADGEWERTAAFALLVTEGHERQNAVALTFSFPLVAIGAGTHYVVKRAPAIGYFGLGVVAGAFLTLIASPELRGKVRARLGAVAGPIVYGLLEEFVSGANDERAGMRGITPRAFVAQGLLSPRAQVARIMARSHGPLLASEIRDLLVELDERSAPALRVVRQVLIDSPEFHREGRYRWVFGGIPAARLR